jgi:hypothetical protein
LLQPYKKERLGLMSEVEQQELRWHLAVMVPRFALNARERQSAMTSLRSYLKTAVPSSRPLLCRDWLTWQRMCPAFDPEY